ncbi:MAG: pyridoxal phosphate-dependent aminotransferase [Candidatus Hydrothermarchaeota archaeon]
MGFAKRTEEISLSGIRKMFELIKEDTINLALGEPDFTTPKHICDAAKNALNAGFTHYTSTFGMEELREAIANKLKKDNNLDVTSENIMVTCGASEAILCAILALVEKGDEVIITDPGFVSYDACVKIAEGKTVYLPVYEENEFSISLESLSEKITKRTKLLIINSPNNPTGSVFPKSNLKAIADLAEDHDFFVLSDEVYEKILYEGEHHSIGKWIPDRTITVNAFSKTYAMTGWRIGYLAASEELMEEILKIHQYTSVCASSISQFAALAALNGPQDFVYQMKEDFLKRRNLMLTKINEIEGFSCMKPKGAFYVFVNAKALGMLSTSLADYIFEDAGVLTVPGIAFGKNGEGYLRISYATSMDKISLALDLIKKSIEKLSKK